MKKIILSGALWMFLLAGVSLRAEESPPADAPKKAASDEPTTALEKKKDVLKRLADAIVKEDSATLAKLLKYIDANSLSLDGEERAVVSLARGIDAAGKEHYEEAEAAFKQAFWEDPDLAKAIAQFSEETRTASKMRNVRLDLGILLSNSQGKQVALRDALGGKKYLLLDFWASWCGPCMANMPKLRDRYTELAPAGISVVAINTEGKPDVAEKVRVDQKMELPWLLDKDDDELARLFVVSSIPRAVLLDADGKVLYNGHPAGSGLDAILKRLH